MFLESLFCAVLFFYLQPLGRAGEMPVVINTWAFKNANADAWQVLNKGGTAVDAVEVGCESCEKQQCDYTVGYGGSPDENGETTLDAMLMDGRMMNMGAVANLRRIKSAIKVARKVMDLTSHSLLVGDLATAFAKNMGFVEESLTTNHSREMLQQWQQNSCQPNFWVNVLPDPKLSCGPYQPASRKTSSVRSNKGIGKYNHDTIGIAALDIFGNVAAGTSSNGASHKIAGRVGDSPIPGAGCYADNEVGAAAATGDGDIMMRFLPSFLAVEEMRRGAHPRLAAETAIRRIAARYAEFSGAIIALRRDGRFAAACHGMESFPYSVSNSAIGTQEFQVKCISLNETKN